MTSLTILHFNDVYNIEPHEEEPKGGAARFASYVKSCQDQNPLVLFSGDCLNPSLLSIFLKGEQMVPVLNAVGVKCAVYGNHDFDFGVDHLQELAEMSTFPWLLSNARDNLVEEPLAKGEITQMITWNGIQVGLIGLVEKEWIDTLATLDPNDVTFLDYVDEGQRLANKLKQEGADVVIALTHMRWQNDIRLAETVDEIDLYLGGHDHDYDVRVINGKYVIKSGTDFRNLSKVTLTKTALSWDIDVQRVDLVSSIPEDPDMKKIVSQKMNAIEGKMDESIGEIGVRLDGRFSQIRTQETNLGNFVTDIMLTATKAEIAFLNSGTFRSDRLHPVGDFKIRDLMAILPLLDPVVVIRIKGYQLLEALENGVSLYPRLEGRFPQVSGLVFGFDPSKPPGQRVEPELVKVQEENLQLEREYRLCTKEYVAKGKDGYVMFKNCPIDVDAEECQSLCTTVQNHFESVHILRGQKQCKSGHRQSLLCLAKMTVLLHRVRSCQGSKSYPLIRQRSIHDAESVQFYLCPKIDGRIFQFDDEKRKKMIAMKQNSGHD